MTLDYFLGIEVKRVPNGSLLLTQSKYITDLLERAKMTEAKGISSPMIGGCKLSKEGADYFSDAKLHRSVVGALQYATITRPEISYAVNKVCQFMSRPLETHWTAVKRILRYLKGTTTRGLHLQPATSSFPLFVTGFSDADWASDPDDRRSTSGSCIFLGPNFISWRAKKQTVVARSSTEAEYTAAEILWVQTLLHELQVILPPSIIYCDNMSTVAVSHNPILHARTKHMELDLFFVREKVLSNSLKVLHFPSEEQVTDVLTKAVSNQIYVLKGQAQGA